MDIQNGKFLDNGGSGYILKPRFLRDAETEFNPKKTPENSKPVTLTIKVGELFLFLFWLLYVR